MADKRTQPCPCGSGKRYKKCCGLRGENPIISEGRPAQENVNQAFSAADFLRAEVTAAIEKRLDEAEACFRRVLTLKPDFAEAYYNLGLSLSDQGRLEEAEESFRQALTLKPDHVKAHNNLGLSLNDLGRPEEAEESFRQALTLKPDHHNLTP